MRGEHANEFWNALPQDQIEDKVITCGFIVQAARMEVAQAKLRFIKENTAGRMVGSSAVSVSLRQ